VTKKESITKDEFVELADQNGLILLRQADVIRTLADEIAAGLELFCEDGDDSVLKTLYELSRQRAIGICVDEAFSEHNLKVVG